MLLILCLWVVLNYLKPCSVCELSWSHVSFCQSSLLSHQFDAGVADKSEAATRHVIVLLSLPFPCTSLQNILEQLFTSMTFLSFFHFLPAHSESDVSAASKRTASIGHLQGRRIPRV